MRSGKVGKADRERAPRGAFLFARGVHAKRASAGTLPSVPEPGQRRSSREEKPDQGLSEHDLELDELRWLMAAKQGRRFVWRLLERAGVYRVSFTGDALSTAFNEGTKNEGRYLLGLITKHCPERYLEMLKEARTNERRNDRSTSSKPGA